MFHLTRLFEPSRTDLLTIILADLHCSCVLYQDWEVGSFIFIILCYTNKLKVNCGGKLVNGGDWLFLFVYLHSNKQLWFVSLIENQSCLSCFKQIMDNVVGILIQSSWWMLTTVSRPLPCVALRTFYWGFYRIWVDVIWGFMLLLEKTTPKTTNPTPLFFLLGKKTPDPKRE